MFGDVLRRLVLMIGFVAAIVCLAINIWLGHELLHSAFMALCVMLGVDIVLYLAAQMMAKVMIDFLMEQRRKAEADTKKKRIDTKKP